MGLDLNDAPVLQLAKLNKIKLIFLRRITYSERSLYTTERKTSLRVAIKYILKSIYRRVQYLQASVILMSV
jgi:hypothetical protein